MANTARIVSHPTVMMGKPVVRGTRITVEYLLRISGMGLTVTEIVEQHPHLTKEDVQAAYTFAAERMRESWRKAQPEGADAWHLDGPEWTAVEYSN